MIYLDNAATANPKAPGVGAAMLRSLDDCNANPGHGAHRAAVAAALAVFEARQALADLLGAAGADRLVFTSGATAALNQAIAGVLAGRTAPAHVVCTTWEHNAVLRPIWDWRRRTGGAVTVVGSPGTLRVSVADVRAAIRPETILIVATAASNVTGALQPVADIGEVARAHRIPFVVDGAQAAGHLPVALRDLPVDMWAAPGHKGLLGPQGVGVLYVRPGLEVPPLLLGGAGFDSARPGPPDEAPERYEAGTLNTPGILGLGAAAAHLLAQDLGAGRTAEIALLSAAEEGLRRIPGLRVIAPDDPSQGVGVVSCTVPGWPPAAAAQAMDRTFGICARAGLHCAPLAHVALGTAPGGAVRFSFGPWTTAEEVAQACEAVAWLAAHPAGNREGSHVA